MSLGLGVLGLGTAGAAMLSVVRHRSDVRLAAVADARIDELDLPSLGEVGRHDSLDAMLDDDRVDAVHIATPTPLHAEHVARALMAGRHVIVEKPVTIDSASARALASQASRHDRVVLVGHSESFEPYVAAAREVIADGEIGEPLMIIARKFTDWMRRPRLREELEPALGGGLIRRQGVHQIDVVRSLGAGCYGVRAAHARLDAERGVTGSYAAWLAGDGPPEIFVAHDGIGRLTAAGAVSRPKEAGGDDGEEPEKRLRSRRLLERAWAADGPLELGSHDEGCVLVLGRDGEVAATATRVEVTGRGGRRTVTLTGRPSGRDAVLDELLSGISGLHPVTHDLAWGAENLRVCEEIERVANATQPLAMKGSR